MPVPLLVPAASFGLLSPADRSSAARARLAIGSLCWDVHGSAGSCSSTSSSTLGSLLVDRPLGARIVLDSRVCADHVHGLGSPPALGSLAAISGRGLSILSRPPPAAAAPQ